MAEEFEKWWSECGWSKDPNAVSRGIVATAWNAALEAAVRTIVEKRELALLDLTRAANAIRQIKAK